ncbi:hypothetical protein LTR56_005377 [Elasticomyces elasticus]|nr:hypothetical protein LTR22_018662 [Elasticomyces elasticus]KAK3651870.1 hypothetical protein LTR56_005377 [Elasticomyces elasticus]KAK4927765.1 hypothetical protein LTR49_005389 [Elasticomyces elasticus]KAK5761436.1 hypothetical protein LTS12_008397 [Elasticomyces elasticus]
MSVSTPEEVRAMIEAAVTHNKTCALLSLPTKLLVSILEYILKLRKRNGDPVVLNVQYYHLIRRRYLAVSYASKRLRQESLQLFFASNSFRFTSKRGTTFGGLLTNMDRHNYVKPGPQTIDSEISSRLLSFGFDPPAGVQYPSLTNPGSQLHLPSIAGNYVELPGFSVRPAFKQMELVLVVPNMETGTGFNGPTYTNPARDWLYPVRAVKTVGFTNLKLFTIVVKYETSRIDITFQGAAQRVEDWVDAELDRLSLEYSAEDVSWSYLAV